MKLASIQLSVGWVGLLAALCACGSSHPQSNSNTNWLRECSATKECNGNELCACGVCTIACVSDDACQSSEAPDAQCISVAAASCAGPSKGAVCTAGCKRDAQCGDGELSCVDGSCIQTQSMSEQHERDAAVEPDADRPDGSPDSGGSDRDASVPSSCEQRLGCAADSACLNEHCQHLWSGNGCEPAAETRPACDSDADCAQGTVCHLDGTCIEPGKCDRFGMTTLATLGDIGAMVLTKDSVFVLERGSEDALGNHRSDGAIQRVAIADGSTQTVVGNLYRPLDLKVDSDRVYWRQGARGELAFGWADRADGGNQVSLALEGAVDAGWAFGPDHIYALISKRMDLFDLFRIAKGTSTLERLGDNVAVGPGMSIDSEYLYFDDFERWSLADNMVLGSTMGSKCAVAPSSIDSQQIFCSFDANGHWYVGYVRKADSRQIALAELTNEVGTMYLVKAYRDHVYVASGRPIDDPRVPKDSVVQRVSITGGQTETVALLADGSHLIDISDQGLFSIQGHRLVRQVIDEYASGPTPAQGAEGGPCFGDLACDDGLSCVDALCAVPPEPPPTCEERLGCGAGFACFREHCQQLWSGNGCEPAPEKRPVCIADADCDQGLVCHVDRTCIEPGKCDRFGMTTYASVREIGSIAVTKDSVFLLDYGSEDAFGNHHSDGAILRVALADGAAQPVVSSLNRPLEMAVDSNRVYWRRGKSNDISFGSADRADGGNPLDVPFAGANLGWAQSATDTYFLAEDSDQLYDVFRVAKGTTTVEKLTDENWAGGGDALLIDSQYLYVNGSRMSLADNMLSPSPHVAAECMDRDRWYYFEFLSAQSGARIGAVEKSGGAQTILAVMDGDEGPAWMRPYRNYLYFARYSPIANSDDVDTMMLRAPLVPGDSETLGYLGNNVFVVAVSDEGVFWIDQHRLLRKVIEDYATGLSPAQGSVGGPCYGDLACDAGLTCIDMLCQ